MKDVDVDARVSSLASYCIYRSFLRFGYANDYDELTTISPRTTTLIAADNDTL